MIIIAQARTETLQLQPSTSGQSPPVVQTVTLRLVPRKKKKVSWREDTVDNEHMMKKKSKICCIFHEDDECDSGDEDEGEGKEKDHHHDCKHASNGPDNGSTSSGIAG